MTDCDGLKLGPVTCRGYLDLSIKRNRFVMFGEVFDPFSNPITDVKM